MTLHVICGFPCMPLLRRELVSIVPATVDQDAKRIFGWSEGRKVCPRMCIRFLEPASRKLSAGQA